MVKTEMELQKKIEVLKNAILDNVPDNKRAGIEIILNELDKLTTQYRLLINN